MKLLALAVSLAAIGNLASAAGNTDFVQTRTVTIGDGFSPVMTAAELAQGCSGDTPAQDIDASLVALPPNSPGHVITVSWADDGLTDFDVYFLDAACNVVAAGSSMATANDPEVGEVPEGAAFAEVDLYLGANATFTLTVEGVASS